MAKDNTIKKQKENEKNVNSFRDTYDTDFIAYNSEDKKTSKGKKNK
jgi:hypothetical protein